MNTVYLAGGAVGLGGGAGGALGGGEGLFPAVITALTPSNVGTPFCLSSLISSIPYCCGFTGVLGGGSGLTAGVFLGGLLIPMVFGP